MTPFKRYALCSALIINTALIASPLYALPDDRDQVIYIDSQSAEFQEIEGTTVYSGNVSLKQGSILLKADRLTIYVDAGKVSRLLAEGNAYYEQIPEIGADKVVAQGESIEYLLENDVITLNQNASLTQEGATLNGNRITYDVRNHLLRANSQPGSLNDRIRVVLPPTSGEE